MLPAPIASVLFVDGVTRPVHLDADCRQYVVDEDGQPVYGVWVYIDEPEIVEIRVDCQGAHVAASIVSCERDSCVSGFIPREQVGGNDKELIEPETT